MTYPMINMPQGAEWLVILAIFVFVFGAAKLPELARGTGQALRIFKSETKGLQDDSDVHSAVARTTTDASPSTEVGPVTHTDVARCHGTAGVPTLGNADGQPD